VTQELRIPIGDNREWNVMESNHLLEIKIHHMGCIIGFTEWYEMAHFGETVHYHHREVFATLGAGYTIDKSHTDI